MIKRFSILILFLLLTVRGYSQEICPLNGMPFTPRTVKSLEVFKSIPILDHGRLKPLETYADNLLLGFSGKKTYDKKPAIDWLAKLLFAPQTTIKDRVFLINNPEIPITLNVAVSKNRRYTFNELSPAFDKISELAQKAQTIDSKQRDVVENELIRIYENLKTYSQLTLTFSFAMPHPDFTLQEKENLYALKFPLNISQYSFLDMALKAKEFQALTAPLERKDADEWTNADRELLGIVNNLFHWNVSYQNLPVHIVAPFDGAQEIWLSPWDGITVGLKDKNGREELIALAKMLAAYWNGKQLEFDVSARQFISSTHSRYKGELASELENTSLELFLNKLNPFFYSKVLYFLVFVLFLLSLIIDWKILYKTAWGVLVSSFLLHFLGILLRCLILKRPPVSNLYETFIFVSFVSTLAGMIIERINKRWLGLIIASLSGFVFLTIAEKFSIEGDTLQMLIAVLNSNFWLGTHVLSITTGYAGACVAGIVGHVYILQAIFKARDQKLLDSTYKVLMGSLGFALTMTFLGTNLGGIWADQSWGRFWGWDPKENGALMIVIWTALLFHLKVGRFVGPLGLSVGSALGLIVVMWAWFGVNLLSIGLHSYGFTSGLALNLTIYLLVQLVFLAIAAPIAYTRQKAIKKWNSAK